MHPVRKVGEMRHRLGGTCAALADLLPRGRCRCSIGHIGTLLGGCLRLDQPGYVIRLMPITSGWDATVPPGTGHHRGGEGDGLTQGVRAVSPCRLLEGAAIR